MNKVYKSIWNAVTRSWTAVSEVQRSKGKKSHSLSKNVVLILALSSAFSSAFARTYWHEENVPIGNIILGSDTLVYWENWATFRQGGNHSLVFTPTDSYIQNFENGATGLINLSSSFYHQTLLTTGNLDFGPADGPEHLNTHANGGGIDGQNSNVTQNLLDSTGKIATLHFAVGEQAYQLARENAQNFGITVGEDSIRFNGSNYSFNSNGIAWHEGEDGWVRTLALLTEIDIEQGKTLNLDNISGQNLSWAAKISGAGNIRYAGLNDLNPASISIESVLNYDSVGNLYTGATEASNVTLNLNRQDSFGQTSKLTATNATINVQRSDAWTSVKNLSYSDTNTTFGSGQSNFVIQNSTGEVASFDGVNTINTQSSAFTYEVQGDMSVGGHSASGTVQFNPSGTLSLNVADELTIFASSAVTGATDVQVGNVLNLYNLAGIDRNSTLQIGNQLNFIDIDNGIYLHDAQSTNEGTFSVRLDNSTFAYSKDLQLSVSDTTLSEGSSLTVYGVSQLGDSVHFDAGQSAGQDEPTSTNYNKLTINKTDDLVSDGSWTLGTTKFSSDDANAIIIAQGNDRDDLLTLPNNEGTNQWTDYKGWVRVSNSNFYLNKAYEDWSIFSRETNPVGLSVGNGGRVSLTESLTIDRFGWAYEPETSSEQLGSLDLTDFNVAGSNLSDPVLTVEDLYLDGEGLIVINPDTFLDPSLLEKEGTTVLDYDNSDIRKTIIKVTNQIIGNEGTGEDEKIHLVQWDSEKQSYVSISKGEESVALMNQNDADNPAAYAHWGYQVNKDTAAKELYVAYEMRTLELVGETNKDRSLLLSLSQATDNELGAEITGEGIIDITGADGDRSVKFTNNQNKFAGLVELNNADFEAVAGGLGQGETALNLQGDSTYSLVETETVKSQSLNGLRLGENASISLGLNTELILNLNSNYLDAETVTSSTIADGQLKGDGNLSLTAGALTFTSASTLFGENEYNGQLSVHQNATMIFSDGDEASDFTLKSLAGNGLAVIDTNTIVGDLSKFTGSVQINDDESLIFNSDSILNHDDSLTVSGVGTNNSVEFSSFDDLTDVIDQYLKFSNIGKFSFTLMNGTFATSGPQNLVLVDSVITRNQDVLDTADINGESTLIYNFAENRTRDVDISSMSGTGTLDLNFKPSESATALTVKVSDTDPFTGTLRFENSTFEIGTVHGDTIDDNNEIRSLHVGNGSTLVMNGKHAMEGDLTLSNGSSLDFTKDNGFVTTGESVNLLDMSGHQIHLDNVAKDGIEVKVNPDAGVNAADVSGTLMNAIHERTDGIDLILVSNIDADQTHLEALAAAMRPQTEFDESAQVTYHENGQAIAEITTTVGTGYGIDEDNRGYLGLTYGAVNQVAVYGGQTAELLTTGNDTISASIVDKDQGSSGSVRYYGNGTVTVKGDNTYTGSTTIDGGVRLIADSTTALGNESVVQVGTRDNGVGNLEVNVSQTLGALNVTDNSSVTLIESADVKVTGSEESVLNGSLIGSGNLSLSTGQMSFNNAYLFDQFSGKLIVHKDAQMVFNGQDQLTNIQGNGAITVNNVDQTVSLKDLSEFDGKLSAEQSTVLLFNAGTQIGNSLSVEGTANNKVVFDYYQPKSDSIDSGLTFTNINDFEFNSMEGTFNKEGDLFLTLTNSDITRTNRTGLDARAVINSGSLNYEFSQDASGSFSLANIRGDGTLGLEFAQQTELHFNDISNFGGQIRIVNGKLEVGANHNGDQNFALAKDNALFIDQGSTLVMNGEQYLNNDLTLGANSSLDFNSVSTELVNNGTSQNALHMSGNEIILSVTGENVQVSVDVDPSIDIQEADTTGSLMDAVRVQDDANLSLILIDGIGNDAQGVASHMQLSQTLDAQTAVVTYHDQTGEAIADITTGVGLAGDKQGNIGLMYGTVNQVAIYDGKTSVFEATGKGDVIAAQIVDHKEGQKGSVHFTGNGKITLTNSSNSYSGKTTIDGLVRVIADAANALGNTERVIIGGKSEGSLTVNGNQDNVHGLALNENGSLVLANQSVLTINDSEDSFINGDLTGNGSINLVKSQLKYTNDVDQSLSVAFETDADSMVTKVGAGKLDFEQKIANLNLNLTEGALVLDNGDSLGAFNVANGTQVDVNGLVNIGTLMGTGATFNMTVAFGEGSQEELVDGKPGLHIGNGSGDHFLNISSKDLNKGAEESIKVVHMDSGNATFALSGGKEAITSGGYDYLLKSSEVADGGMEYFLSSIAGDDPVNPDDPDIDDPDNPGVDDPDEPIRNVTVTAGSYIGIAYAAQLFDLSLHDRVGNRDWINPITGEKQTTSLWMHHTMSHERFRDSTSQLRMRTTSNTTMLGGDFVQLTTGDTGLAYAGLMGGYGTMDTKSRSKVTHLHSKAETDAWGVGAYAGWKANSDGQTGPYVDGWVMFTHANSDVTGVDQNTEDIKGEGLSASLEAGWGFKLGSVTTENGKVANFTVEPHASVTWFGMQYDEIHNAAQDVKFEGENNVRTRLGARAILTQEGNNNFNAFVEANWVHNTQEYGATISGLTVDQAGSRNQGEGRIGVDWRVTDSLSVWGRIGASFGSDSYNEREGSIGVRYQF